MKYLDIILFVVVFLLTHGYKTFHFLKLFFEIFTVLNEVLYDKNVYIILFICHTVLLQVIDLASYTPLYHLYHLSCPNTFVASGRR